MGDAAGSDKRYAFRINRTGSTIHVFESAIDLLSYATIMISSFDDGFAVRKRPLISGGGAPPIEMKMRTGNWRAEPMLSLGGVYAQSSNKRGMKTPAALSNVLENHPEIKTIALHLDNDFAGRNASRAIAENLQDKYTIRDEPPPYGKDCNTYLMNLRRREHSKKMGRDRSDHPR